MVLMFLFNCGDGSSEEVELQNRTYQEGLDELFSTYDEDFKRLIDEAHQAIGKTVITYSSISDEFTIPKYLEIVGSHYDYGRLSGYIGLQIGIRLNQVSDAGKELNDQIIKMYTEIYPQFLEIVRGVSVMYGVPVEEIDFKYMEQGFFNDLWYILFKYPEFEQLMPPRSTQAFEGNCAIVSANVEDDIFVGRNFDNDRERPTFVMKTKMDGVYEVMCNASYSVYHWVMDGINEKGLVMATANSAAPEEYYRYQDPYPDFPVINEHHMFRVALETCSTVDEVIELYQKVRPWVADFADHLMVVDAKGNSAVIEIDLDRNPVFFTSEKSYQVITNTVLLAGEEYVIENCGRYRAAIKMAEEGIENIDDVKQIMERIRGLPYGYMSLFDIKNGLMRMVLRHDFDKEFDYLIDILK